MRAFLLHPEDDLLHSLPGGVWDVVIDLGRNPKSVYEEWQSRFGCPVFGLYDFAIEIEDLVIWRDLLRAGAGQVVDRYGIDWWDVIGLLVQPQLQDLRLVRRVAEKIGTCDELTVSRPSQLAGALGRQLRCPLTTLRSDSVRRAGRAISRYGRAASNLNFHQLRQVVYDKYDPQYLWRRRFAATAKPSPGPVVLLPSAYSNVTRTAFRYAQFLPDQQFLLVLARETGEVLPKPANVETAALAAFASPRAGAKKIRGLENAWDELEASLQSHPEFEMAVQLGVLSAAKRWLGWGVAIRDAWNAVFERRAIISCMSADDTNPATRIPLLLARQRGLPAVAGHHGALDAFMAFKSPAYSIYVVKGEMEQDYLTRACRVDASALRMGAPSVTAEVRARWSDDAPWIVFFTEPYETDLWRTPAIYREVVPQLCEAARRAHKKVVVKLHPFESVRQRRRMLRAVLSKEDRQLVSVVTAPLTQQMLQKTWCAVTVESTTAFECAVAGIPAFLCGWLRHAYYGYAAQFARFGIARMLDRPDELAAIPEMVRSAVSGPPSGVRERLMQPVSSEELAQILCSSQPLSLR